MERGSKILMEMTSTKIKKTRILFLFYFLICGLEGGTLLANQITDSFSRTMGSFLKIPTTQIVVMSIFGVFTLLFFCCSITLFSHSHFWSKTIQNFKQLRSRFPQIILGLLLVLFLVYFSVNYLLNRVFGPNSDYVIFQLEFLSTWFYLLLLQSIILVVLLKGQSLEGNFSRQFLIILGTFFAVWVFIITTGIGIIPDSQYWNVAGVPVMAKQVAGILFLVLIVDFLVTFLKTKLHKPSLKIPLWVDVLICLLLWAGAAYFWNMASFGHSFFANGPYPPNNDFVPYSDSSLMDLGGQYMLIGEGLNYPHFTEKTLYVFFLGLLHYFAGQSYLSTTSLQIVIFAIFPVLLFWLGKKFQGRLLGVSLGIFAIIKEQNALISTFKISVSNSRLYMTEFPTAIGMLALGLALFFWFRNPQKRNYLGILAGGILGFSSMIRTNPILLIPLILTIALFVYKFEWKKWLIASLIFMGGFFLAIGPWVAYEQVTYGTNPYTQKIDAVWKLRFTHTTTTLDPTGVGFNDIFLGNFNTSTDVENQTPAKTETQVIHSTVLDKVQIVAGHFLNNEIKSLFTIPFQLYPLDYTAILDEPYWKEPDLWHGDMSVSVAAAFALNLGLIALGITYSWKKWRFSGLVPLIINIGYYMSNALGRTSGSRYLLPVDWVAYFYYFVGILFLIQWIGNPVANSNLLASNTPAPQKEMTAKNHFVLTIVFGIVILVLGASIPIINNSFPKLYPKTSDQEIINKLATTSFYNKAGFTEKQISEFVDQQGGTLVYGRMLYPREDYLNQENNYGLFLTVLTPEIKEVFIPLDQPLNQKISAGSDVLVIGCNKDTYTEGLLTYIFGPDALIEAKGGKSDFSCSQK